MFNYTLSKIKTAYEDFEMYLYYIIKLHAFVQTKRWGAFQTCVIVNNINNQLTLCIYVKRFYPQIEIHD